MRRLNPSVLITAALLSVTALAPFANFAPNRVAEAQHVYIWQLPAPAAVVTAAVIILIVAGLGLFGFPRAGLFIPGIITLGALILLSLAEEVIPGELRRTARIGGSYGFWGWIILAYLFGVTSKQSSSTLILIGLPMALFLLLGGLDYFGPVREFAVKRERFFAELTTHITLAGSATFIAAAISVPAGIAAHRFTRFSRIAFGGANIVQTLPSLALFGLMIAPLSWLSMQFPTLRSLGVKGVGNFPALIALSGYAALPILRNTFTGLRVIPPGAVDAGKGMGMGPFGLLWMVELPLALPVILGGLRIAFVQAVGNTAVAALIGAGGLGYFVFQGLGQAAPDLILLGVLPLILLTLGADKVLKVIELLVTPKPLREAS